MVLDQLVATLAGTAIAVAGLAWLTKSLLTHLLSKDMEAHKGHLSHDVDVFKQRLAIESAAQLETLRSDLQRLNTAEQIRFSALHAKRADLLAELHGLLVAARRAASSLVIAADLKYGDDSVEERERLAFAAANRLAEMFEKHRLYLDADLADRLQALVDTLVDVSMQYTVRPGLGQPLDRTKLAELVQWWDAHRSDTRNALTAIEDEFRKLLGSKPRQE